ncbi:PREDICTED: uncharacterized protein LOC109212320 [Nicotiana attenuata]|uniref:DUF4378 domain-containing protein n=1 Tax=Nicotiana attenuata TaxID=49451 RepID=A0A314KJ57_NICAT|nr:PREDICTED: uncharacterized protein LOC109212320 [Nicotiana attenuata]OIT28709.1 hypothetical protein A4A49_26872 [Nicotiana attenuata]
MGKEWLYWATSRSTKNKGRRSGKGEINEQVTSAGCMCAVFQIFDLPHFHLATLNQHQSPPPLTKEDQQPVLLKGIEAPRNSLDLDEERPVLVENKSVSTSLISSEETLNIPVGIQIRTSIDSRSPRVSTSTSRGKTDDFSSESPGPKTPTLVARLMGLENYSPLSNISTSNNTPNSRSHSKSLLVQKQVQGLDITGTASLPETPRVSSESRRSDVEYHHRLSLQINKENIGEESQGSAYQYNAKKMARRRRDDKLKQDDENRSPGYYARQIVKQVKDRVSRKVGHDITNIVTSKDDNVVLLNNNNNYVVLLKPMKKPKALNHLGDDNSLVSKQSITPSSSPRLRLLETKNKLPVTTTSTGNKIQTQQHSPRLSSAAKIITNHKSQDSLWEEIKQKQQLHQRSTKKGKGERYHEKPPSNANSDPIHRKKEEQFVHSAATNKGNSKDNKCKKTALSNVPTFFPLKKEPSSPPTKLLIKKSQESDAHPLKRSTQLSCSSSHSYNTTLQESNKCNGTTTTTCSVGREEFQYIQRILKRAGIDKCTPVSFAKLYSQSHPLDPCIFHHLELFHPSIFTVPRSSLSQRCNRKLIFQLVNELLVEILEPYYIKLNPIWLITPKKRRLHRQMNGLELINTLVMRIQSLPSANCQVLEDIDALIDKDLRKKELGIRGRVFEEEGESIVLEIERDIFESLLHEYVAVSYRIMR